MDSLAQSLHAGAIAPEAAILIALVACLLADLAGEKAASRFVPPFSYIGLGTSLVLLAVQWNQPVTEAFFSSFTTDRLGIAFRAVVAAHPVIAADQLAVCGTQRHPCWRIRGDLDGRHRWGNAALRRHVIWSRSFVSLETLGLELSALGPHEARCAQLGGRTQIFACGFCRGGGVFLYGTSLLYGVSGGSTNLTAITTALQAGVATPLCALALVFVLATVAFKISAVPFHQWTPDVYEGSPTPVVAFLSVGSKAAGFAWPCACWWAALTPSRPSGSCCSPCWRC